MKILNRVGGAFLLLVLGIAAVLGFQTPTGRPMWVGTSQAVTAVFDWVRQQTQRLSLGPTAGHGFRAIGVAAFGLVLILVLLPKPISLRVFEILLLVGAAAAFVLWDPAIVA